MSMHKSDYELIAGSLSQTKVWNRALQDVDYKIICENLANSFNRDNPRFDRDKFLAACGIETEMVNAKEFDKMFPAEGREAGTFGKYE